MTDALTPDSNDSASFDSHFRDPGDAPAHPLAWALGQRAPLIEALRGLFSGPQAGVQLRLWCFLELASQPLGLSKRREASFSPLFERRSWKGTIDFQLT